MLSSLRSFFAWSHFRRCWSKGFVLATLQLKCSPGTINFPAREAYYCCLFKKTLSDRLSFSKSIGHISALSLPGKTCSEFVSVPGTEMSDFHEDI